MSTGTKRKGGADRGNDDGGSHSDSDVDMINVDFVFEGPSDIDFNAIKRLFIQLFYTHAPKLDAGAIADYIITASKERQLGTVIKVQDDEDNDPFAVISAAEISAESPESISQITRLLLDCVPSKSGLHKVLQDASKSPAGVPAVILVLHERMINMPPAAAAPLYRLLAEELAREATQQKKQIAHLLFFSRVFHTSALDSDEEMGGEEGKKPSTKRRRGANDSSVPGRSADEMGFFHPEDEIIAKYASHTETFRFPSPKDAAESFETPLFGRLAAVPMSKWPTLVEKLAEAFAA